MRRHVLFTACLAVTLVATACQDQDQTNDLTAPSMKTAERQQPGFTRGAKLRKLPARIRVSDLRDPSRAVVPTTCDDNTAFTQYFLTRAFQIPLPNLIPPDQPFRRSGPHLRSAALPDPDGRHPFFGYNGEYNQRMNEDGAGREAVLGHRVG